MDNTVANALASKLARWKQSLVGDGFRIAPDQAGVLSHSAAPRMNDELYVWQNAAPPQPITVLTQQAGALNQYKADLQAVKNIIKADWDAIPGPDHLKKLTVVNVGHVTVPYSGWTDYENGVHGLRAFPTDLYYADIDGSPETWGDDLVDEDSGGNPAHELTTNGPGDGRFDTGIVPLDALKFTVTGSGQYQFTYNVGGTEHDTVAIDHDASAEVVDDALDDMLQSVNSQLGATVVKTGSDLTVRIIRKDSIGLNFSSLTAQGISGNVSVSAPTTLPTGGTEIAIGRIDMANLDAAFPDEGPTNDDIELALLERYFDKDHAWRMATVSASDGLIDPITPSTAAAGLEAAMELYVGDGNVVYDPQRTWISEFDEALPHNYMFASATPGGDHDAIFDGNPSYPNHPVPRIASYHFEAPRGSWCVHIGNSKLLERLEQSKSSRYSGTLLQLL